MAYRNDRVYDPKVYTSRLSCCKAVSHDTIGQIDDMTWGLAHDRAKQRQAVEIAPNNELCPRVGCLAPDRSC
jgi:hypothetical protein